MVKQWLPPNDIYPGFYLNRIGHQPEFERKQMENLLKSLGIETSDQFIEMSFHITAKFVIYVREKGKDEFLSYEEVYHPKIGTTYPLLVFVAQTLSFILLKALIGKGIGKIKQSWEDWVKGKEEAISILCPEDLTPKECELLKMILEKSRNDKKFAKELKTILKGVVI